MAEENLIFNVDAKTNTMQLQAVLTKANPKVDGSMSLGFVTQELSSEQKLVIMENLKTFGVLLFREGQQVFSEEEIPEYDPKMFDEDKSPSKRLRAVLFVLWQHAGSKGKFDEFYRGQLERVIEHFKAKLPKNV